jgi:uncharacterized DUF497 family protein
MSRSAICLSEPWKDVASTRCSFAPAAAKVPARSLDESRPQVIGRIGEKTWSAFITYRNDKIRIISVRRARADEEARYLAD